MKTFEFKSQICTTKEQSEKLLALGLKKETADMWYPHFASTYPIPLTEDDVMTDCDIPAWSLHRLIEIITTKRNIILVRIGDDLFNTLIERIRRLVTDGTFNQDYLEGK